MFSIESFCVDITDYKIVRSLGGGRFDEVFLAEKGGENFAIRQFQDNSETQTLFLREIETLITIRYHPAICKFYGYDVDTFQMIFEYIKNGSLKDIFTNLDKKNEVAKWDGTMKSKTIFGIACAMHHLHNHGIFHRYLTPSCILFDGKNEPHLTDFYFSRHYDNSIQLTTFDNNESFYQAPEMTTDTYDNKVDLFSFGMILYHIVSGKLPSHKSSFHITQYIKDGGRPDIPHNCNSILESLIKDLWSNDPNQRPLFIDIIRALYNYDKELFEGTNMDEYKQYRERILQSTYLTNEDKNFLKSLALTKKDIDAFTKTLEIASKGDVNSMIILARMFEKGIGTTISIPDAFEWYKKAADKGNSEALYKIANFYAFDNEACEADEEEYMKYLKKASDLEYIPAIIDYALILTKTNSLADMKEAIKMLKKIANPPHKCKEAQYRLGDLYENQGNFTKAIKYYNLSREQGFLEASIDYAGMLLEGKGIAENINEGINILKQAAAAGLPMANYNLGFIYEKGKYEQDKNGKEALNYYLNASRKDNAKAITCVGKAYFKGKIVDYEVEKDPVRAARLFETAADMNDPEGLYSYAVFELKGYGGTPINIDDAVKDFTLSAELGYIPAMMKLYSLYNDGINGIRNPNEAMRYLQMAADRGYTEAIDILNK